MKEKKPEKTLIMTVGLPRSGKTTWAMTQGCPVVCPDYIRVGLHGQRFIVVAEPFVWAITRVMVIALFAVGHDKVILDSTAVKVEYRKQWRSSRWTLKFKLFKTTEEECIKRARDLNDDSIIPIIQRMAKEFEPLDSIVS